MLYEMSFSGIRRSPDPMQYLSPWNSTEGIFPSVPKTDVPESSGYGLLSSGILQPGFPLTLDQHSL